MMTCRNRTACIRFISGSQQNQQTPGALDNGIGGSSCFGWNFGEVATSLQKCIRALAGKCAEPMWILKRDGDWFGFTQSLQTQRARLSIRTDGEHELNRTVSALHPPRQHDAKRRLFLINTVDVKDIFVAGRRPAEALRQLQTPAAEDARFKFVMGGAREKETQITLRLSPRA